MTPALSLAYAIDRRARGQSRPQDYDDSLVPGQIVCRASVPRHQREERDRGLALRWSYGSAFGLWYGVLRRGRSEPTATALFGATPMSLTLTMFSAARPHAAALAIEIDLRDGQPMIVSDGLARVI
ncbi:MAG: hypothetical protein ACR2GZ_07345 [Solirubrobacteraceae bacterium]